MENKIKSRRGVYYDLSKSPHKIEYYGIVYIFSSAKKKEMFIKKVNNTFRRLAMLYGKIYTLTDNKKDYDISPLIDKAIRKCYDNMRYK
jgi:YHS domain-containing protein